MNYYTIIDSPVGQLLAISDGSTLIGLHFTHSKYAPAIASDWIKDETKFLTLEQSLETYFAGQNPKFDQELGFAGTEFQQKVWHALLTIPTGQTTSYQAIAEMIGHPKAVRAVGTAIGRNPVCIIVPCHRVIASNGTLGGYAGGLPAKQKLLTLESK
jgi:O-6-methylguanine DNA methyltransferase